MAPGSLKISLPLLLGALRHAPRGSRVQLLQGLLASHSDRGAMSSAEVFEFPNPAAYAATYEKLAPALGHAGKLPPPQESEFLQSMLHRPVQHPGAIGWNDYFFLTALISILAPRQVIEIGTLTGFSAAIIAAALSRQHGNNGDAWVDTIDVRPQCLIDETRPTGFEIAELIPTIASMVRLHIPHDSTFASELAQPDGLEVVFIDADHRHPRPLLDLLRLAPYVRSGGWMVLHDTQLGTIGRKAVAAGQTLRWGAPYGAEFLFDHWPFRKISGGNIGAVQVPVDKSALIPFALRLMSVPFEITGKASSRARRALFESLGPLA